MRHLLFQQLISPLGLDEFLREFLGTKPRFFAGEVGRFSHLMPWNVFNNLLAQQRLVIPRLRLARPGKTIEEDYIVHPVRHERAYSLDLAAFTKHVRDGATIVVNDVNEIYDPVGDLCRNMERALGEYVQANIFAGWHECQGFATHWDDHDVFVLQVSGRKHWRVYEPTFRYPLFADKKRKEPPPTNSYWEGMLEDGDLLYIPRGWWHDAVPKGVPTLHLSLTVPRKTGIDLLQRAISQLRNLEVVRKDLPRFSSSEEQLSHLAAIREEVCKLLSTMTLAEFCRETDSGAASYGKPSFPWSAMPEWKPLPENAQVHWIPSRVVQLRQSATNVSFEALGCTFTFDSVAAAVLKDLIDLCPIQVRALLLRHSDTDLGPFILELMSAGLVSVEFANN